MSRIGIAREEGGVSMLAGQSHPQGEVVHETPGFTPVSE
jgi:hypothetical protein